MICSRKRKFRTAAAQQAMERVFEAVVHIGGVGPTGWPRVYRCSRCRHWGHSWRAAMLGVRPGAEA